MTLVALEILLLSVFITILLVPSLGALAIRMNAVDIPNERKVHTKPIPRIGGLAMAVGTFVSLLVFVELDRFLMAYLCGGFVLVLIGLVDDFKELSAKFKFSGQIVAAVIAVWSGGVTINSFGSLLPDGWLLPLWLAVPLTVFVIVGVTNAINLADGLDGLAGGISLLIVVGIGYLAYQVDYLPVVMICLALAGALFGFLRFNTHPATIFMGDTGSQFLGYSVAVLSISLTQDYRALSPLLPLLLAGVPILDTLTVMTSRIAKGQSPFVADKNHLHHNLMRLGLPHPESVLVIYLLQTMLIVAAVSLRFYQDWLLLGGYLLFSGSLLWFLRMADRTNLRPASIERYNQRIATGFRLLKRKGKLIKIAFPFFEYGLPFLLVLTAFLANGVPQSVRLVAGILALFMVVILITAQRYISYLLHPVVYLLIPCAVYFSDRTPSHHLPDLFFPFYNMMFGLFTLLLILISRLSRRSGGFKSTPLDFLVIILALVVPFLATPGNSNHHMVIVVAKIIMLYFCFEVLFAELRKKWRPVAVLTVVALLCVAFTSA
jgi:UDP-GlcNAc:undecaprenyl-phosphate GlcNAc-1-phosphate transferase